MTKDNTSHAWRIRIGSLLVPLAHAAGMNTVTMLGLRFLTDSLAISAGVAGTIFAALALAAMGWFLAAMGYVASSGGAATAQSESAVLAVRLCVSVVPALALLCAIFSITTYDLDPASLEDA